MSTPFLSEIRVVSFNFPPKGWALCNGQLMPINQNQALFSLLGTTYGGDGRVNFGLPNLQGRVPIHMGSGFTLGNTSGEISHTLNQGEMPQHNHIMQARAAFNQGNPVPAANRSLREGLAATNPVSQVQLYGAGGNLVAFSPSAITNTGGSQPHANQQPYLVLNMIIALQGIFPSQN
ncbi:Microcystin-dependent protein [Rhizobiales bacterium GAS188]|nr:Microcystin-dependent protein [Rhizobiales bacterium GAS188]